MAIDNAPSVHTFPPESVVIPADQAEAYGGPSLERMRELWGAVPDSLLITGGGAIVPIWRET